MKAYVGVFKKIKSLLERQLTMKNDIHMYWWKGDLERKKFIQNLYHRIKSNYPLIIKNFGDQLSPAIIEKLSGRRAVYSKGSGKLVALGSLFKNVKSKDIVWGTGLMNLETEIPHDVYIKAVRGPFTRKAIIERGIECPEVFGDPGIFVPDMFKVKVDKIFSIGILPHFEDYFYFKDQKIDPKINVINPLWDFRKVLSEINKCEIIVSSSLHGIIVSEGYGIPTAGFVLINNSGGGRFKFHDYYASTNREYSFLDWKNGSKISEVDLHLSKVKNPCFSKHAKEKLLFAFPFLSNDIITLEDIPCEYLK